VPTAVMVAALGATVQQRRYRRPWPTASATLASPCPWAWSGRARPLPAS